MSQSSALALNPRKLPKQARSLATVEAIFTATIQVLLIDGASNLTTTRVAERAGVSVGTMYQYFPHKQALLLALLQRHIETILDSMERAVDQLAGKDIVSVGRGLADAWLAVKLADPATSRALYLVAAEFDIATTLQDGNRRIMTAIEKALLAVPDAPVANTGAAALMLVTMLGGSVRAAMEADRTGASLDTLREELPKACSAYLAAAACPQEPVSSPA